MRSPLRYRVAVGDCASVERPCQGLIDCASIAYYSGLREKRYTFRADVQVFAQAARRTVAPSGLLGSLGRGADDTPQAHLGGLDERGARFTMRPLGAWEHRELPSEAQGCRRLLILAGGESRRRDASKRPSGACGASGKAVELGGRPWRAGARGSVSREGLDDANAPAARRQPRQATLTALPITVHPRQRQHNDGRQRNHNCHHQRAAHGSPHGNVVVRSKGSMSEWSSHPSHSDRSRW